MDESATRDRDELLSATATVPQHVVHRTFVAETVLLNLQTGKYHGLNPIGGTILEQLEGGVTLRDAAAALAERFDRPVAEVEDDVCEFCRELEERRLIELKRPSD